MPIKFPFALLLSFLSLLFLPFNLYFFAPTLVIAIYSSSFLSSLWKAFLCGLIFDLFTSTTMFGMTSLVYTMTTLILYRQKSHFFEDSLSTLPLMTFAFSALSTLLCAAVTLFATTSFTWFFTDVLIMPLLDAVYAILLFSMPFHLYKRFRRVTPRYEEER